MTLLTVLLAVAAVAILLPSPHYAVLPILLGWHHRLSRLPLLLANGFGLGKPIDFAKLEQNSFG